mgnify:CR=1 FL=1
MFLQTVHVLEIPTLYKILNEIKENFSFSPSTPYAVSRASCDLHLKSFYNYRKAWFERGANLIPGDKPLSINCELVSTCNLACSMCYTISEKFQASPDCCNLAFGVKPS